MPKSEIATRRATGKAGPTAEELRARAEHRLAALGEMTGGIAHDFRNILAIIESGLKLAERNADAPDQVRRFLAAAQEGVERGLKLTSQLLTFGQQQELELRPADANDLLRRLEVFLKYGAGPRLRVTLQLAPHIPRCVLNAPQFNAAILNLVVNARDATPDGGEVVVSTERCELPDDAEHPRGTYVRIRVSDNGQGMSADTVAHIFDPFFTTKGERGTGLGLPQVCACVRLMRGHLKVASKPGIGTTFDLLFPADLDSTQATGFATVKPRRIDAGSAESRTAPLEGVIHP